MMVLPAVTEVPEITMPAESDPEVTAVTVSVPPLAVEIVAVKLHAVAAAPAVMAMPVGAPCVPNTGVLSEYVAPPPPPEVPVSCAKTTVPPATQAVGEPPEMSIPAASEPEVSVVTVSVVPLTVAALKTAATAAPAFMAIAVPTEDVALSEYVAPPPPPDVPVSCLRIKVLNATPVPVMSMPGVREPEVSVVTVSVVLAMVAAEITAALAAPKFMAVVVIVDGGAWFKM